MTRDDEFIGQLEDYLDDFEGVTPLPDAVRNSVRAQLPSTRQTGPLSRPNQNVSRRLFSMGMNVRIGLVAAAVLLAGIVGINLISRTSVGPPATASPTPFAATWSATNDMLAARSSDTATLLPDGNVLVAGGYGANGALDSAELYDPISGSWSATGKMITARGGHTATLLLDGRVLVVGGDGTSEKPRTAELYDPGTGTWTVTGSLRDQRRYHTATLLSDGRVLVAGGTPGIGAVALYSAEVYDPRTGMWTSHLQMREARYGHTATLLPDGKVLVVGGNGGANGVNAMKSAELYDPADGSWTATGDRIDGRTNHTATLLADGMVLVAGGYGNTHSQADALASAELYDPSSGSWTATGDMIQGDSYGEFPKAAVRLAAGMVLVVGSLQADRAAPYLAELYDPRTGSWASAGEMIGPTTALTATLLADGRVLVAGGSIAGTPLATAELYDPGLGR
jgi:N-acetylneuraminic acid mutarotase